MKTFVVWLHNHVDSRDDEWKAVKANSIDEAEDKIQYNTNRFSMGQIYTLKEFKKEFPGYII